MDAGQVLNVHADSSLDKGRKAFKLRELIKDWQEAFNAIEKV